MIILFLIILIIVAAYSHHRGYEEGKRMANLYKGGA